MYTRYYGIATGADMLANIEQVCRDERFEQHRYHILDFSDATDFNLTEREMLVNSGVLVGAAFVNHQVLIAAVVRGRTSGRHWIDFMRSACLPSLRRYFQPSKQRAGGSRSPVSRSVDTASPRSSGSSRHSFIQPEA